MLRQGLTEHIIKLQVAIENRDENIYKRHRNIWNCCVIFMSYRRINNGIIL